VNPYLDTKPKRRKKTVASQPPTSGINILREYVTISLKKKNRSRQ
jgi:hypothetical protein